MAVKLIIALACMGCSTKAVTDVDELYRAYSCDVGVGVGSRNPDPNDTSRPDSIAVTWEDVVYMGDLSYTEDDAVVECEVVYSDSTVGMIVIDGVEVSKPLYCECEKSN